MKTYIVRITDPLVRSVLSSTFEKVGEPRAIVKTILVTTNKPKSEIQKIPGVFSVLEDSPIYPAYIQDNPPNWALSEICGKQNKYEYNKTGKNVDIYIVDSGVHLNHVEFGGRATTIFSQNGSDHFPNESHGTIAASQAAGITCGVAKEANILNVKVAIRGASSKIIMALDRVLEHHISKSNSNPSILSMSFGNTNLDFLKYETLDLVEHGVICVASAHNFGEPQSTAPACHPHVISVGATDKNNNIAYFSNYGQTVDILAPGYANYAADLYGYDTDHYGYYYGTSFACPIVAGVLAIIVEGKSVKNINDVEKATSILLNYADTTTITPKPGTTNRLVYSLLPTSQSKMFVGQNETNILVGNSGTFVYGNFGYESVTILPNIVGVWINGNVEEIFFPGPISDYKFLNRGNGLLVYQDKLLIALISVQESGVKVIFQKAYNVTLSPGGMKIDNNVVSSIQSNTVAY